MKKKNPEITVIFDVLDTHGRLTDRWWVTKDTEYWGAGSKQGGVRGRVTVIDGTRVRERTANEYATYLRLLADARQLKSGVLTLDEFLARHE